MFEFPCPNCGVWMPAIDEDCGTQRDCIYCGAHITVPDPRDVPERPPPREPDEPRIQPDRQPAPVSRWWQNYRRKNARQQQRIISQREEILLLIGNINHRRLWSSVVQLTLSYLMPVMGFFFFEWEIEVFFGLIWIEIAILTLMSVAYVVALGNPIPYRIPGDGEACFTVQKERSRCMQYPVQSVCF